MGYNPKGPSRGEWVAVAVVFFVILCACSALTELFNGDILASMIPEEPTGYEVAMQDIYNSDPVFGPLVGDLAGGLWIGIIGFVIVVFVGYLYWFFNVAHPQPNQKR
jgi:hypothetical protein